MPTRATRWPRKPWNPRITIGSANPFATWRFRFSAFSKEATAMICRNWSCLTCVASTASERLCPDSASISSNLVPSSVFARLRRMANEQDPDAALMLRVKQGDQTAFAPLVDKYKQPVMNLAYRMLRDVTEAEDLAQNVFVQVYKSAHRYRVASKFSTWLFTIARNLCLNELRRRSRHPAHSMDAPLPGDSEEMAQQFEDKKVFAPPETLLHGELEQKINEALADLPENQRTAILLCRQEELSYEEIAQVLGCSLSATKSLIHRGRETLKERLKPYLRSD